MSKLETNQVDPATGTTLTLGTSGDTIDIPAGVTTTVNRPAFFAELSADQKSKFQKILFEEINLVKTG